MALSPAHESPDVAVPRAADVAETNRIESPRPLRVLIVDDCPEDAELIVHELRAAGFDPEWRRADTESEYVANLQPEPDVILSDYAMPRFSGLRALELLREGALEIPFILISGTIGEDIAVAAIKQGAVDYLMKDRLARLGPAIEQALEQGRLRQARRQAEERIAQLNRVQTILGGIDRAIVHIPDQQKLLDEVCRVAVDQGGFKLAWIGMVDSEGAVQPVARAGVTGYLEGIRVVTQDVPDGRGPVGTAIRENRPVVIQDVDRDARMAPWHERARQFGLHYVAAFPVRIASKVAGSFQVYAPRADFFDQNELRLLTQVSDEISFALTALADLAARKRLEQEVLEISAREQRRIGQDLHDDICQWLAGTEFSASALAKDLARRSPANAARALKIAEGVRQSLARARMLARGLAPAVVGGEGLAGALRELSVNTGEMFRIRCLYEGPETMPVRDEVAALHLYRIAQEAISNAVRHGGASEVAIVLQSHENHISMLIHDNGCGIPQQPPLTPGMGLRTMHYRAGTIGAALEIRPGVGVGTEVFCTFPKDL